MISLQDIVTRTHRQLRLTPLVTENDVVRWLKESVQYVSPRAVHLTSWVIIPCKSGIARYLLPADHISTIGVYYNNTRLQTCNSYDAQLVSPTGPVYYYEDEWHNEASDGERAEFAIHYTLNELWPLQLMRSQNTKSRKTITLVGAPTSDGSGVYTSLGGFVGSITYTTDTIHWPSLLGTCVSILGSSGNLVVFYKNVDVVPSDSLEESGDVWWSNLMGVLYTLKACSLALDTEDDEYDRFFGWLYGYMCDSVTSTIRNVSITRRFV